METYSKRLAREIAGLYHKHGVRWMGGEDACYRTNRYMRKSVMVKLGRLERLRELSYGMKALKNPMITNVQSRMFRHSHSYFRKEGMYGKKEIY